jgi:hypothetical protein
MFEHRIDAPETSAGKYRGLFERRGHRTQAENQKYTAD